MRPTSGVVGILGGGGCSRLFCCQMPDCSLFMQHLKKNCSVNSSIIIILFSGVFLGWALNILIKANKVYLYSNTSRFSVTNINYTLQYHMEVFQVFLAFTCIYTDTLCPPCRWLSILPPPPPLTIFKKKHLVMVCVWGGL